VKKSDSIPGSRNGALQALRAFAGWPLLLIAVLAAYWPVFHAGFVWNDDTFLTANPLIAASDGLRRFWFSTQAADYWPLTSSSLWLEWRLWGMHAAGYHAVNLALHLVSVVLLWRILLRLAIPGALIGAMIFAVHPVNVESVAWITQQKNLLALVFYLASVACWWNALSPTRCAAPRAGWYSLSLAAFVLAMLSKGSVATLPLVLAGFLIWQRRWTMRDWLPLVPFLLMAATLTLVNVWFQAHGSEPAIRHVSPLVRLLGAGAVVWFYLGKALWPIHLSFFYPQWQVRPTELLWWLPLLLALATTAILWRVSRPVFFGWLYFCIMLVPVMGLTDVYFMRYSLVADHYQHLALIGVAAGSGAVIAQLSSSRLRLGIAATIVALGVGLSCRQCLFYRTAESLYRATLRENPHSALAHNNLGVLLMTSGQLPAATAEFESAVHLDPDFAEAENDLGVALAAAHRQPEAIGHYQRAVMLEAGFADAHYNWGVALRETGGAAAAREQFEQAVRLAPVNGKALNALGLADYEQGQNERAVQCFEQALHVNPRYADVQSNLGCALLKLGRVEQAAEHFEAAAKIDPDLPDLAYNLGVALARSGKLEAAIEEFQQAVKLKPSDPDIRLKLAAVLLKAGRKQEALDQRQHALQLQAVGSGSGGLQGLRSHP